MSAIRSARRRPAIGGDLLVLALFTVIATITLAMSADLLMSPISTCKFGGMGLPATLRSLLPSGQVALSRSLTRSRISCTTVSSPTAVLNMA